MKNIKIKQIHVEKLNIPEGKKELIANLERIRKSLDYNVMLNEGDKSLVYRKGKDTIVFYPLINKAVTIVNHPKHGRTELNRDGLTDTGMLSILFNPRSHTFNTKRKMKKL